MSNDGGRAVKTFAHAIVAGAALVAVIEHAPEFSALLRGLRCPRCGYRVTHPLNRHTPDGGCWSMEGN